VKRNARRTTRVAAFDALGRVSGGRNPEQIALGNRTDPFRI